MSVPTLNSQTAARPVHRLAPAAADLGRALPEWTHPLAFRLYLGSIFLLPVQLEIESVKDTLGSRLPPGDILLALSLLLAPTSFRVLRRPVAYLPLALPVTLAYGIIVSLTLQGYATTHAVSVKFLGAGVLMVISVLTIAYARAGHAARIIRTFLLGVAVWGLVGYIDWTVADILPWLDPDVDSRFGALQFDPNNAGATFAVAMFLSAIYGRHLFARRSVWLLLTAGYGFGLSQTLSRGSYLSTGAALIVVLVVARVGAERWMKFLAGAVILAAVLLATGTIGAAVDDFSRRPDTVSSRNEFIDTGVDRWVDSRGLGIGLGTFLAETDKIVHNTAVWLVVEMSLPGLLFFVAMVAVPLHACLRLRAYDHQLAIALIGAHTTMVVASVSIEALYQRSWWMIIGLTVLPTASVRAEHQAAAIAAEEVRTAGDATRSPRR